MPNDIATLRSLTLAGVAAAADLRALDALRVHVLGKTGALTIMLKELGKTEASLRRERGAELNRLKDELTAALEARRLVLE